MSSSLASAPVAIPRQINSNGLRNQRRARAGKATSRTTVRAAVSESPVELPKGQYCESNHEVLRRPTRCAAHNAPAYSRLPFLSLPPAIKEYTPMFSTLRKLLCVNESK